MRIVALVACDLNGAIGKQGDLPWKLPSDLARFKQRTMGACIIMGRKTHESIGRPLPGRLNIVISRTSNFEGVIMARSPAAAITACGAVDEAFIIGGGEIYRQFELDVLELTVVQTTIEGADTFFEIPAGMEVSSIGESQKAENDEHSWVLKILERTQ
ncbi:MAG: dihydrofolate reductase [Candidatus Poseidoniales archaeon]|jgi:dihydrofolate reductase